MNDSMTKPFHNEENKWVWHGCLMPCALCSQQGINISETQNRPIYGWKESHIRLAYAQQCVLCSCVLLFLPSHWRRLIQSFSNAMKILWDTWIVLDYAHVQAQCMTVTHTIMDLAVNKRQQQIETCLMLRLRSAHIPHTVDVCCLWGTRERVHLIFPFSPSEILVKWRISVQVRL